MILTTPLETSAYEEYYADVPLDRVTVMNRKPLQGWVGLGAGGPAQELPYGSPSDYFFQVAAPVSEIPVLLSQPMTDKKGTSIVPVDATMYNNPATEGLFTLQLAGSPLINNLQDNPAVLSGSDPMPSMGIAQTFVDDPEPQLDTTETDNIDLGIPGIHIPKSVLKETGIFIIGAGILVVGVIAMTR